MEPELDALDVPDLEAEADGEDFDALALLEDADEFLEDPVPRSAPLLELDAPL